MILRVSGCLLALLSLFPLSLRAQSQASDASLSGFVLTKDGSRLAGARVKARNLSTGLEREQTTTDSGAYTLTLLPPGLYRVSAELAGFNAVTRESITLRAGQAATIDFDLPVGDVATIVNVTEAIPVVETGKTVQSNTYDERAARAIPVAGRSLLDFFVLQPGVNAPPLSTGGSGTGTPSTVYGGTGFRQMNVDGVSNNIQGGARNLVISQEAIAEFQTVTNFSAEFGRVAGGLQNAFTRSGTNEWHGSGFFFHRRRELAATPKLLAPGAPKPDFFRSNYGGTGGGPLRRNKAFLFTSYERWAQDLPVVSTFGGANQADIARQLGIAPENIGAFITTFRAHTLTTKADWELHPKHRLSSRFNYYFDRESPLQGGQQTREVSTRFDEDPFSVTSQLVSSISPTLVNEFRFHFARRPIENGVLFPERPQINISGIGSFNGNSSGVFSSREMGYQFINNLTWIRGRHTLKFGADLLPVRFRERTRNVNGTFQFDNLPQYLNTINGVLNPATGRPFTYSRFTQSVGQEFFDPQVVNQGYFVQDDVRLTSRLKLNLGLRYELFLRPEGNLNPAFASTGVIPQDYNNIAPRLGLAWDITGNGRTVIRGGYGIYYNTTVAQTFATFQRGNGAAVRNINVVPTDPGAPAFNRERITQATGARALISDLNVFAPEFRDPTVHSYFVSLDRELWTNNAISISYWGTASRNLPLAQIQNINLTGTRDGRRTWSTANRPNPAFGNIFVTESTGYQDYNGLVVTYTRRFSNSLSLQGSYHLSKTDGVAYTNAGGAFTNFGATTSPSDPQNPAVDFGPGDFDMRHRFTLTGIWEPRLRRLSGPSALLINGWQLSTRTIAQSGFSFTGTTGRDENGDSIFNDRPTGIGYNSFKLPNYFTIDLRLTRNFKIREKSNLEVIAEVFNIQNRVNVTNVNRNFGPGPAPNATFNVPTAAETARQFQLAIRYSF